MGAAMKTAGAAIKPKKKCCKDKPRCSSCPVVLMRLSKQGYAERIDDGKRPTYAVDPVTPKKAWLVAKQP